MLPPIQNSTDNTGSSWDLPWTISWSTERKRRRIIIIIIIRRNGAKTISVSWHTKWHKQQEISSNLTVLIININNSTCAIIKILLLQYSLVLFCSLFSVYKSDWNKMRYLFSVKISTFLPLLSVYNRLISNRKSSPGNITRAWEFQTLNKSCTRLYFLMGMASEARIEKQ